MSHHSAHTLTQIEEPYLAIEEATTYELSACYNVSIDCHSSDMVANIVTSTMFDGKVYAKGSPLSCVEDIENKVNSFLPPSSHFLKITQNAAFEFWQFPPIFVLLKLTCLVTLFDRKLQVFKNSPKLTFFGHF